MFNDGLILGMFNGGLILGTLNGGLILGMLNGGFMLGMFKDGALAGMHNGGSVNLDILPAHTVWVMQLKATLRGDSSTALSIPHPVTE